MDAWHTMGSWAWVMMAFGIVFWVAVVALIARAVTNWTGQPNRSGAGFESAREILDRRFAAGELDIESYKQAVEALGRRHGLEGR